MRLVIKIIISPITSYGGMGEKAFCKYEGQIPHQQIDILSLFVDGEFLLSQKRRCCVEPPPSSGGSDVEHLFRRSDNADALRFAKEQYYYGSDILGSIKFVTGGGGQKLKRIEYDVFGGIYKGNSPYGLETGYTGVQKRHGCRWFRAETKFRKETIAPF